MLLTPTELERLTIYTSAELARKRRAKGLKLSYPEATAIIADEILEGAREGRSVAELISFGSTILNTDDVMPGVAALMPVLQVEATFPDGTKLVTVHDPIRSGKQKIDSVLPGEIITPEGDIELNVAGLSSYCEPPIRGIVRFRWEVTFIFLRSTKRSSSTARRHLGCGSIFPQGLRFGSSW